MTETDFTLEKSMAIKVVAVGSLQTLDGHS